MFKPGDRVITKFFSTRGPAFISEMGEFVNKVGTIERLSGVFPNSYRVKHGSASFTWPTHALKLFEANNFFYTYRRIMRSIYGDDIQVFHAVSSLRPAEFLRDLREDTDYQYEIICVAPTTEEEDDEV